MCNNRCICSTYRGLTDGASVCQHVTASRQKLVLQTGMKPFRTSSLKRQQGAACDSQVFPVLIRRQVTALQKQQAVAKEQATNRAGSGCSFACRDKRAQSVRLEATAGETPRRKWQHLQAAETLQQRSSKILFIMQTSMQFCSQRCQGLFFVF